MLVGNSSWQHPWSERGWRLGPVCQGGDLQLGEQKCSSGRSLPWSEKDQAGLACAGQQGEGWHCRLLRLINEKPIGNARL